jgi:hypothetical protein
VELRGFEPLTPRCEAWRFRLARSSGVALRQLGVAVSSWHVVAWLAVPGVVVTWLVTGFPDLSQEGRSDMGARQDTTLADARIAARRTVRMREARAVRRCLDAVIAADGALDMPWGVWADTVRQDAEACHGVAYPAPIEEADAVVLPGERHRIKASGFTSAPRLSACNGDMGRRFFVLTARSTHNAWNMISRIGRPLRGEFVR